MAENKRVTGDYTITTLGANSKVIIDSDLVVLGDIDFENIPNRIYVSKNGDDSNDGLNWENSKLTIKAACAAAQALIDSQEFEVDHVTICVAAGDYTENCPITVPAGCAIIGDNLRSVTVRPSVATSNVFYLDSNCYVWGITVRGHRLFPSALDITPEGYAGANGNHLPRSIEQTGFAFSFRPGAVIRVSPYIQNCSSISGSGVFGNPDYVPGGGGILVDPSVCAEGNRINSIVLDAFTQINQGGIGCKVVGRGYMQLVSFFVNFCQFGILCVDGGHVTLLNSNCSFGNYAFWAEGSRTLVREPDEEIDQQLIATATDTIVATNQITLDSDDSITLNLPIKFRAPVLNNITAGQTYYIKTIDGLDITVSEDLVEGSAGETFEIVGSNESGSMGVLKVYEEVIPYETARIVLQSNRATYQNAVIVAVDADVVANYTTTCTATTTGTNEITCGDTTKLYEGMSIRFSGTLLSSAELNNYTTYYVENIVNATTFTIKDSNDNQIDLSTDAGSMTVSFYYDKGKCERDVGYIVDAIIQDLATESFYYSRRAGTAYWDGVTSLVEGQITQTVDAIGFLETAILLDLFGDPLASYAETHVRSSLATIQDFIENGPNRPFEAARTVIQSNKSTLASLVTAWINLQVASAIPPFSASFTYDQAKCERDVGYIIDALVSDLITGSSRASRTAGNAYYRGTVDIPLPEITSVFEFSPENFVAGKTYTITFVGDTNWAAVGATGTLGEVFTATGSGSGTGRASLEQNEETAAAFAYLLIEILNLLTGDAAIAQQPVTKFMNTITDIINNGPDPDDLLLSPLYEPARTLLTLNKEFIKEEAVAYTNNELSLSTLVTATTTGTNVITCVSTRILNEGTKVRFGPDNYGSPVFGGIVAATDYYVRDVLSATTFTIEDENGSIIALTTATGSMYCLLYNQDKCKRDVGYLLDAVISDLATNSQEATVMAGNAYWRGAASISQEFIQQIPDTLRAIDYAKRLALKSIESDIEPPIGSSAVLEPRDLEFGNSGNNLYVLGGVGPKVYQFDLDTAWDTTEINFTGSLNLSAYEITPQGIFIDSTGTYIFIIGTGGVEDETDGRVVYRFIMSTPWDVTSATYGGTAADSFNLNSLPVNGGYLDAPSGITFSLTGNMMFIVGSTDSTVVKFNLGTNWNLNTATFDSEYAIAADNFPTSITFDSTGNHMYLSGATNDVLIDYNLVTPYDLTSTNINLVETTSITDYEEEITGIRFKSDGNKVFIIGLTSDSVNQFNLLNSWDISSIEFENSTPTGFYSTPYQNYESQTFVSTVTDTDGTTNVLTCSDTFYLKVGDPIKFKKSTPTGAVFGGVVEDVVYYIREKISSTEFTISETLGGAEYDGITTAGPDSMTVAPSGASAAFEVEKNFNTIIRIIRDGAQALEEEFGSLVEATGYTLSYAGAGIDYTKLSKGQGGIGVADPNKYTIELDGGRVFITATDERGDFYVGKITPSAAGENARPLFRINQATGSIDGRAFYQSIFGFVAPFVLALTRRK